MEINRKEILLLQQQMKRNQMDIWFCYTGDCHHSEYTSEYFDIIHFLTGFSGSNAGLVVTEEEALLWTDGRYFIQAERELAGTGIKLMKMMTKQVPTVTEYLLMNPLNKKNINLGYPGDLISFHLLDNLQKNACEKGFTITPKYEPDMLDMIWVNRPKLMLHGFNHCADGTYVKNASQKIQDIRKILVAKQCDYLFLNKLDDIMWVCNIRGRDVAYNPVSFSYLLIGLQEVFLFILPSEQTTDPLWSNYSTEQAISILESEGITVRPYLAYENEMIKIAEGKKVMANLSLLGYQTIQKCILNHICMFDSINPTESMKAKKDENEIACMKEAYLHDSAAVCRFLYWLTKEISNGTSITETDAADKMDSIRSELKGFLDLSFPTISAYGANAAMMHYQPNREHPVCLEENGSVYLIDSGGQYINGTTDVTRSVAIGIPSQETKQYYTAVIKGMLGLQNTVFLYGCTGINLDIMAREPLWKLHHDYKCGTGHGIGFCLNVHEGPQAIRWHENKNGLDSVFEAGMIVSDEPGCYIKGKLGIRVENILLCTEDEENEDGDFLRFTPLTFVPLDRTLIDETILNQEELHAINQYQEDVYQTMLQLYKMNQEQITTISHKEGFGSFFTKNEIDWLYQATRPIKIC